MFTLMSYCQHRAAVSAAAALMAEDREYLQTGKRGSGRSAAAAAAARRQRVAAAAARPVLSEAAGDSDEDAGDEDEAGAAAAADEGRRAGGVRAAAGHAARVSSPRRGPAGDSLLPSRLARSPRGGRRNELESLVADHDDEAP